MQNSNRLTILIVDDSPENLGMLAELLEPEYRVLAANAGDKAVRIANSRQPDLILLDVMMPEMDGYEVLARLKAEADTANIPVIFLTAMNEVKDELHGLEVGAVDYIGKPIVPALVLARVRTQLELKLARDRLQIDNNWLESEVSRRMQENDLTQLVSIRALAHLAETRDPETGNHILRTQGYVHTLACQLQSHPRFVPVLNNHYIDLLTRSAPLHDIGKVGIPDYILQKPGKLTAEEWVIMKTHAQLGAVALEQAEKDVKLALPFLRLAKEIAHWHHEKWDGSGYPDGLAGDDIPLSARIMTIADVFDALVSPRVYKPAMSYEQSRAIIAEGRGSFFDPDLVDAFLAHFNTFCEIADAHRDAPAGNQP
jgi:putative two-component system response regulator